MARCRVTYAKTIISLSLGIWVLVVAGESRPAPPGVSDTDDLYALAEQARAGHLPILLVISREDCPYCHLLKREILNPMLVSGELDGKVIVRELMIDSFLPVRDFNGEAVEPDALAERYRAYLTPTLLFLDHRGREVAERIVGINTLEYYGFFVSSAIEKAHSRVVDK